MSPTRGCVGRILRISSIRTFHVCLKRLPKEVNGFLSKMETHRRIRAMSRVQCRVINVPVRSPDMHCIQNVFHITSKKLKEEAKVKRITKESFGEFKKRVITTMKAIPVGTIDELIASTDKRLDAVITSRGGRIRY